MMKNYKIVVAYDLDNWLDFGVATPVYADLSQRENSHFLVIGVSGAGKSYFELSLLAKISKYQPDSEIFFCDYKGDDSFSFLRTCDRYYSYHNVLDGLQTVYEILQRRMSGEEASRKQVTLIFDEYVSCMLALQSEDNKKAKKIMNQISELLLMGRSMSLRLVCTTQRPEASVFPSGSRLNFGIITILGVPMRSILEMVMPSSEYIEEVNNRTFDKGEGILLTQGAKLSYIKVPTIRNMDRVKELCIQGLSRK